MKTTMRRPCDNCPFRHDVRGYLHGARAVEIANAIVDQQQRFPCHKTTEFDAEGDHIERADEQHCAGAMIMLEHMERPNQWMRWMERVGQYDHTKLVMTSPVFTDAADFIEHHTNGE